METIQALKSIKVDGIPLEEGDTLDVPDAVARNLCTESTHRGPVAEYVNNDEDDDLDDLGRGELWSKSKDELLDIADKLDLDLDPTSDRNDMYWALVESLEL